MKKQYPCDGPEGLCPFKPGPNSSGFFCRDNCGLGVDGDHPDFPPIKDDDDDLYEPYRSVDEILRDC
jgi:hypothetical protein